MSNGCRYEVTIRYKYYDLCTTHHGISISNAENTFKVVYDDGSYTVLSKDALAYITVSELPTEDSK